jgi:valyl-tRNA synthetase
MHADRAAMAEVLGEGGLSVVAGDAVAVVGRAMAAGDGDVAALERARLAKELALAERLLAATRAQLANEAFAARAPQAVVDGVRARQEELVAQVGRLSERLGSTRG